MTMTLRRSEHGFTLVEAMVVIVLAGVVTIGLLGFYLNSQATWMDGSSQALAQRDATLLLETIEEDAHEASSFSVDSSATEKAVTFFVDGSESSRFSWHMGGDSLIYHSATDVEVQDIGGVDQEEGGQERPVTASIIEDLQLVQVSPSLLRVARLRLRSTDGARITTSAVFALNNAP